MSLAAAKRRYKILLREQDRLKERNSADEEVDKELRRLREEHPELSELTSTVSTATASMLSFAEAMSVPEVPPPPTTPPPPAPTPLLDGTPTRQQPSPAPPSSSSPAVEDATSHHTSSGAPTNVAAASTTTSSPDHHMAMSLLTHTMLFVAPYLQPPRTSRWLCLWVLATSSAIPVLHRLEPALAAPCHSVQRSSASQVRLNVLFDPIAVTILSYIAYFVLVCRAKNVGAYIVKDLLPAIVTSFVVYSVAVMVLNIATDLIPVRTFC